MALEKKIFAGGGMDKDTDDRFVSKEDYVHAANVRVATSDEGNEGVVENIRSNLLIDNPDIVGGGNKVIGSYEDLDNKKVYYFVAGNTWNGGNSIYQYDTSSETTQLVLQDSLLDFNANHLITGINIVGTDEDRFPLGLLYWTDNFSPPRKLNIDKAIRYTSSGGTDPLGYQNITFDSLDAIKHPPFKHPTVQDLSIQNPFLTDTTTQNNQLKEKSWQFKYRYIYDDGEVSSWSPNSLTYTNNSYDAFFNAGTVSYVNNVLPVGFNSGGELVKRIQLACRNSNDMSDWVLVCDIKKSYLKEKIGTDNTNISPLGVGSNLSDNTTYIFYFYNDGIYNTVDVVESAKLYNDVPHLAKTQTIVDGNRLVYGNVVTGQTADIEPDINLTAGHPGVSAVQNVSNPVPLQWQQRTIGRFQDSTGCGARRCRGFRSWHELRFRIRPMCDSGFAQYRITITDWWTSTTSVQSTFSFYNPERQVGLAISNCDYQSTTYADSFGTPQDIAVAMAQDLNGPSNNTWSTNNIQGGRVSGIGVNSDNQLITNFNGSWTTQMHPNGVDCYLIFEVRSTYNFKVAYGGPYESLGWSGTPGSNGSAWWVTTGFNNQMFQWCQLADTGQAPSCRGKAASAFPGANGSAYPNGNNWSIAANGSSVDTPNVTVNGGNSSMGIQDVIASDRTFLQGVRQRAMAGNSDFLVLQSEELCPLSTPQPASVPTFKSGARHRFGIVYYDRALRSSSVQLASQSEVYIPRMAEITAADPNGWAGEWYIDWRINHSPPEWAEYWQWVYGGNTLTDNFVQFVCAGIYQGAGCVYDIGQNAPRDGKSFDENTPAEWNKRKTSASVSDYSNNLLVDMTALNEYLMKEGGEAVVYEFQEGDVLRICTDAASLTGTTDNPAINESWEFKILGVVGKGRFPHISWDDSTTTGGAIINPTGEYKELLVLANETILTSLFGVGVNVILQNYTMEIYSPKKNIDNEVQMYNEFGHFGRCSIVNGQKCHMQIEDDVSIASQSQDIANGIPAVGRFTRGDAFYRIRATKSDKLFSNMESFHFTDKGRPNAVLEDFRRTRKHSTVLYSEPYVPNTYINGLHSFFADKSFQEFERSYNSIQHLHSKDNSLIVFQEDKTSKALVKRNIVYNVDGSGNLATADDVISQAVPYLGDYGICKNPESFASYGLRMYFVDVRRGAVLRLSQDGFTVISENKMQEYFTDKCQKILELDRTWGYNIYGVWDRRFNEYIVAFEKHEGNPTVPPTPTSVALRKLQKEEYNRRSGHPDFIKQKLGIEEDGIVEDGTHSLDSPNYRQQKENAAEQSNQYDGTWSDYDGSDD